MFTSAFRVHWLMVSLTLSFLGGQRADAQNGFGFFTYQPEQPRVSLYTTSFPYIVNDGGILLGTLQELRYTGRADKDNWHYPPHYEVQVTFKLERAILGEMPDENPLVLSSFWIQISPAEATFQPGDRIFLAHDGTLRPEKYRPMSAPWFTLATDAEIARLSRIGDLLSQDASPELSQKIIDGCFDDDPYFARWCLLVSTSLERCLDKPFLDAYKNLRAHIAPEKDVEVCWQLLQLPETHSVVFQFALRSLSFAKLSSDQERLFHETKRRRLRAIINNRSQDRDIKYYTLQDAQEILRSYSKCPIHTRLELLPLLREMLAFENRPDIQNLAAGMAGEFHEDGTEESWQKVFAFYHELVPLRSTDNHPTYNYVNGFTSAAEHELKRTRKISPQVLGEFERYLVQGDKELAGRACSQLNSYIFAAKREKVAWPTLMEYLIQLRESTPHGNAKRGLKSILREHFPAESAATDTI